MNQESEEKRIKKLFLELKRAEKRGAPDFDKVWAAAASGARVNLWRGHFLRVTATAAALALLGVAVALLVNRPAAHQPLSAASKGNGAASELPWQSVVLVSHWRSPTDFLLESPVERAFPSEQPNESPANTPREN
jgi:anti-sigma-K factor RskA